jgi:hypothetical protein
VVPAHHHICEQWHSDQPRDGFPFLQLDANDDWFLKPGSECDPSFENVWGVASEPALGFEHCWELVGGEDVNLSGNSGTLHGIFDVVYSSYSNDGLDFTALSTSPQLEPLPTISASSPTFAFFGHGASLTDGTMLQIYQQDHPQKDSPFTGLPSLTDAMLSCQLPSGSFLDEERLSSDLTEADYQSPHLESTASSSATDGDLRTPSESFTAAIQCDFEGCGRVCKDREALR